ncbi:5492_t:CDS:2, partial [Gigaspora rosea]
MSNRENSQQLSQDVPIPINDSENGAKDDEKLKNDMVEKSAVIDDLPSYEHATTDATPAYSVSDPSNQRSDPSAVASKPQRRGTSRFAKCCCLITFLIALAIILAVISKSNSNLCNNINVNTVSPSVTSFDPFVFTSFTIDSSDTATQKRGYLSLQTSQNPSPDVTNVTVNTRVASPKQGNAYSTDSFSDSNYKLSLKSTGKNFFNLFGPPETCFRARVDLVMPQRSLSPVAINADSFDVHLSNLSSNLPINVHTTTGAIFIRSLNISNATLYSEKAPIISHGRIFLSDTLIVNQTSDSDIHLFINILANATNPKIYINANKGSVGLTLNNTFSGTYNIVTTGKVRFRVNKTRTTLPAQGSIGNGTALLE